MSGTDQCCEGSECVVSIQDSAVAGQDGATSNVYIYALIGGCIYVLVLVVGIFYFRSKRKQLQQKIEELKKEQESFTTKQYQEENLISLDDPNNPPSTTSPPLSPQRLSMLDITGGTQEFTGSACDSYQTTDSLSEAEQYGNVVQAHAYQNVADKVFIRPDNRRAEDRWTAFVPYNVPIGAEQQQQLMRLLEPSNQVIA